MASEQKQEQSSSPKKFRSVLPHEPLPLGDDDDGFGHVHLQGALEPKKKKKKQQQQQQSNGDEVDEGATETCYYWTNKEDLETALTDALTTNFKMLQLPHPATAVQVMDPVAPFTKIRLTYATPRQAQSVVATWRALKLSPAQLFSITTTTTNNDNNNNSHENFGSHACQVTMITTTPLPNNSWTRSNPPKFRRLLHDRADDEEERSTTRFLFVTGLLENPNPNYPSSDNPTGCCFWKDPQAVLTCLRKEFNQFDSSNTGVEVFLSKKQHGLPQSCHIGMRSAEDVQRVMQALQGQSVVWEYNNTNNNDNNNDNKQTLPSGSLFLDYASVTQKSMKKSQAKDNNNSFNYEDCYNGGEPSRPECTSTTNHVHIPGLVVMEDYVTEQEEQILMATLTGPHAPWAPDQINKSQTGAVKRLVQHYGYVFDYQTADVLRDREGQDGADCPAMPSLVEGVEVMKKGDEEKDDDDEKKNKEKKENNVDTTNNNFDNNNNDNNTDEMIKNGLGWDVLAAVTERTRQYEFSIPESSSSSNDNENTAADVAPAPPKSVSYPNLNQLTVNHYKPGEGIGSHVDTPSAFGDGLMSLSLNGGIVMEFRKVDNDNTTTNNNNNNNIGDNDNNNDKKKKPITKKLVHLPARSLVLMSGDARYEWEHMIVTRRTDTVNGTVIPRKLRVSLTFRTALDLKGNPLPLVASRNFPPTWGSSSNNNSGNNIVNALVTPQTEREHVHAVYDAIATQWHHTRGKRGVLWPGARQFLQRLPPGSIVADVGCGDGKYFPAILEAGSYVIGTDISMPLLQTAFGIGNQAKGGEKIADTCKVSTPHRESLRDRPAVAVADCMSLPMRGDSCDAAICIAVMHHLSTLERRVRCIQELVRVVRDGGTINIQAWALEQEENSRRRFASTDVFVPFNAQPKYLEKVGGAAGQQGISGNAVSSTATGSESTSTKSVAEMYSEKYTKADFDEKKGLVVFQRYCHMYRKGELEDIVQQVPGAELLEGGYESGNYFVILKVVKT